jgi:TonB family protein
MVLSVPVRAVVAAAVSTGLHAAAVWGLVALCRGDRPEALAARLEALAQLVLFTDRSLPANITALDVEMVSEPPPEPPTPLRPGDGTRDVNRDQAVSRFPGRDPERVAPASGQGSGVSERAEWTGRRDAQTLHTQLANARDGYQLGRTRTSRQRRSSENIRQIFDPERSSTWVSAAGRATGELQGSSAQTVPDSNLEADGQTDQGQPGDEGLSSARRPSLPQGPSATLTQLPARGASEDNTTTRLLSDDPHPHALAGLELTRSASRGPGDESHGSSQDPGFARVFGPGTASLPLGDEFAPKGEDLWLRTQDARYVGYFQQVYSRVRRKWVFPRQLAQRLEQGLVVVSFTIRRDGRIDDVTVRKSSGFQEFDHNVVDAVLKAGPLPPVPSALGARDLRVSAPFEYLNPLVR